MLLIKNGTVITHGDNCLVLDDHSVLIDDDLIKQIAPLSKIDTKEVTETIDAKNRVVIPGLINCHTHFYSSFARGLGKMAPSKNFLEVLQNIWWKLDKGLTAEMNYYSALVAAVEAVQHGTTTIIDHHSSPNSISGSLEELARATKEVGVSASLCYEVSDRDGIDRAMQGIEENINFAKIAAIDDSLHAMMGLHASFTLSDETLKRAVEEAGRAGIGIHVHCAEDLSDQEHSIRNYQMRVVERFNKFGVLGKNTILAHGIYLDDNELELIKKADSAIVINTQSNMNNAVGVSDIHSKINKGITVGIGTDAMTNNMFEELRVALWMQKLNSKNPSGAFMEITDSLFNKNRMISNRFFAKQRGEIRVGKVADIAILDYTPHTSLDGDSVLGHLVFGLSQAKVCTTIARGSVLMDEYKIKCVDYPSVAKDARKLASNLWDNF